MKIITLFSLLFLVNIVLSVDPVIKQIKKPYIDTFASSKCSINIHILIEYSGDANIMVQTETQTNGPMLKNGTLIMFSASHTVPIGKNNMLSVSFVDYPNGASWSFPNYTSIDCEPVPSNLTVRAKQDTWVSNQGQYGTLIWFKIFEIDVYSKTVLSDAFSCVVPAPFVCYIQEFMNGARVTSYLAQIAIVSSQNTVPYTPFNVVLNDKQGRLLHTSLFDGLQSPTNPPIALTSLETYPAPGSNVVVGEVVNSAMYMLNILNKKSLVNIASNGDYFVSNTLLPLLGSPSNALYVGFSLVKGYSVQNPFISNVQIIDSQGTKRIGGDNTLNLIKNIYDNIVDTPIVTIVNETGFTIVNGRVNSPYNPDISILSANAVKDSSLLLKYPYGYSNGTVKYHSKSVSIVINSNQGSYGAYFSTGSSSVFFPQLNIDHLELDKTPASISNVEIVSLSYDKILVRIFAKDDVSGVGLINLQNIYELTSANIVYGDFMNGVYEIILNLDIYATSKRPNINIFDKARNWYSIDYFNPILDTNFNSVPDFPIGKFIKDNNINPYDFTDFEFRYNDIDVSNSPFNNTVCFNIANSNKKMVPKFLAITNPLNSENLDLSNAIPGAWDELKGMFCMDFQIPARIFSGDYLYLILFTPFYYDTYYLYSTIGKQKAQLRINSYYADQMPPVITQFTAFPSNVVSIDQSKTIGWDIKIEDTTNGFQSAEFNITSDFDLQPFTIKLTPNDLISGDIYQGFYQLRIPVSSNCRSQTYRISSASISDTQGHTSVLPSNQNVNPLYKFLASSQLTLNITCPNAVVDITPPVLVSFSSSLQTIEVGAYKDFRNITFTFSTTDSGSGISLRHIPMIYLNSESYPQISKTSNFVSTNNGVVTYTCTIQLPYGYGANQGILVSVYGIVDSQMNINGYSSVDLYLLGFQHLVKVSYSDNPVLSSTSAINSTGSTLSVYGHKFGIDKTKLTLQVDYQNGQGWKNTTVSFFAGIILATDSIIPTQTPFYVRVIVKGKVSNSLLVVPTIASTSPCKYEVVQSIVATWINSEKYPYLQASITIKNTGNKPIQLFSFIMANIDQIWGVTVNGNRYTLPSYNPIIAPRDQYSFGYILRGTAVGTLEQVTFNCLV